MAEPSLASPFHRGEREIQSRLGVREKIEDIGQRFIRDHLPDEHRAFYEGLPYLLVGSVDATGRPWASVLVGRVGFLSSPDPRTLLIDTRRIYGDPLNENVSEGSAVGVLGIDYLSRRRNRLTGRIARFAEDCIEIRVDQTFGNCPQYIQAREPELLPEIDAVGDARPIHRMDRLSERAQEIVSSADNFYIATHYSEDSNDVTHGADVSHRGGKPGFVRIDDDRVLTFPDYTGNYHFNTVGNILVNPRAGLLFIDFDTGDLLYLTCSAEIIGDSEERRAFTGAERLVRFTVDEGCIVENAMPIRWAFLDYSPSLDQTGSWEEVAETIHAREEGNVYREYTVSRVEPESEAITSFYLEPEGGTIPCHKAGQFLPIEIQAPNEPESVRRTYTISNSPNGSYYRLSIKREPSAEPHLPSGVSSNYFHDHVVAGTTIRAMSPRGKFVLDATGTRSVVLLSAGVGVTPMISMLEQLAKNDAGCGSERNVWFIHGARNGDEHAFGKYVQELAARLPCLNVHVRYSRPGQSDTEGREYDSVGHVDVALLKELLPFDDYAFYLCGPPAFLESLYDGLKDLNVADERIHYEFFGPGATLLREEPGATVGLAEDLQDRPPIAVRFARSEADATWDPSKGTLLDLAESVGLRPAYSCRSGICQTCSAAIISGDVDYLEQPMASPEEGEALICCSYPRPSAGTDGVVLDI
ncbi:MAG: pyridoxamine 5'-phosphate oxidase family protein [Gammaproteobacteria bacterium]|nr:pyridoxamine 5'-phosphate oxidase family protein [Gammaproteobacteria bacterium]